MTNPEQLFIDDVAVGDSVPTYITSPSRVQLFFFSAATNNGHRIHYDAPYATEVEGYQDVLVHGPLQSALMVKTITDWIGPAGRLERISLQNRASAFPGDELRFTGRVTGIELADGFGRAELEIHEEKGDGVVLMPGTATVVLPRRK